MGDARGGGRLRQVGIMNGQVRAGGQQEHAVHPTQGGGHAARFRGVAPDDLDALGQCRGLRFPGECTHRHTGVQQVIDHRTPDGTGGSGHENHSVQPGPGQARRSGETCRGGWLCRRVLRVR